MKVYQLKRTQVLPLTLAQAWEFFATPRNLEKITPSRQRFTILSISGGEKMYAGQIICYRIRIFPLIEVYWTTEITHVHEPFYFADDQRFGPYAMWHHQHRFKEVPGGVEMTDEVHYAIPLGFIGRLANALFVARELKTIFDYRYIALEKHFPTGDDTIRKSA
ncbi:SRPBCC family protein [Ohtaekwangia sp.]|uniref:SRPBCC family protein n=1 Tax=Ohtaekwangia sp. TaxID=2066019 RepID=UPI002FDD27B7